MNARILIAALCAACFAPAAYADKFYLGTQEAADQMTEGEPAYVEGVLLEETEDRYVIRVEGGQIELPKSQVYKVETTDLTVATIEDREEESQERLAEADRRRTEMLTAAAEARADAIRAAQAAEAAARVAVEAAEPEPLPPIAVPPVLYDPVLHIAREIAPGAYLDDYYMRKELGGVIRREINEAAEAYGIR